MIQLLKNLVERPYVHLTDLKYYYLANYLMGFFIDKPLRLIFVKFVRDKYCLNFSVHWSVFLFEEIANQNEELALKILLELIGEFVDVLEKEDVQS